MKKLIYLLCFIGLLSCREEYRGHEFTGLYDTVHTGDVFIQAARKRPGSWQRGTVAELGQDQARFLSQNIDSLTERTFTIDTISKYIESDIFTISGIAPNDYLRWNGSTWINESQPSFINGYALFTATSGDSELVIKSASKTAYTWTAEDAGFGNLALNRGIDEIYEFDVFDGWIYRDEFLIDPSTDGNTPLRIVGNGGLDSHVMLKIENISAALPATYLRFEDGLNNVFDIGSDGTYFQLSDGPFRIGAGGGPISSDPVLIVNREVTDANGTGNAHSFVDATEVLRSGTIGYNSFDARGRYSGTENFDHYAGFQASFTYNSTGTMTDLYNFISVPVLNAGTVTNVYGFHADNAIGTGGATNVYGFYSDDQTLGTNNYAFYNGGSAESVFLGDVMIGVEPPNIHANPNATAFFVFGETEIRQTGSGDKEMLTLYHNGGSIDNRSNISWKMGTANKIFAKIGAGYNSGADGFITLQTSPNGGTSLTDIFSAMPYGGVKIHAQSAAPTSPELGMMYVDSDDNNLYFYNGSTWEQISP